MRLHDRAARSAAAGLVTLFLAGGAVLAASGTGADGTDGGPGIPRGDGCDGRPDRDLVRAADGHGEHLADRRGHGRRHRRAHGDVVADLGSDRRAGYGRALGERVRVA